MDKRIKKIIKNAKLIDLSENEKAQIKSRLLFVMNESSKTNKSPIFAIRSPYVPVSYIFRTRTVMAFLVIFVVLGSGVSYSAESALPGQSLYFFKTKINEEIGGLFALTPEAKAEWEAKLAERRLIEAENLAVKGKLTQTTRTEVENNFKIHAKRLENNISLLEGEKSLSNALEINSNYESALKAHEKVLAKLGEKTPEAGAVAEKVRGEISTVEEDRGALEGKVASNEALNNAIKSDDTVQSKKKEAENSLNEAQNILSSAKVGLSVDASLGLQSNLDIAKKTFDEGKIKSESATTTEALILFQKVIRISQETKTVIQAGKDFNINITDSDSSNETATTTDKGKTGEPDSFGATSTIQNN